jgi:hypothetical protein
MEATANFPSREGMRDCEGALIITQVIHSLSTDLGGVGKVVPVPANQRGAAEVSRAAPRSRAQRRQTAGPPPTRHQEGLPPKHNDYYGPRAARVEASALDRCDGCGKLGHPAAKCKQRSHPNWNSQHMTIPFKDSPIGRAIKLRANGILRSLPPAGVEWLPADDVWTGGELLKSWTDKSRTLRPLAPTATTAQGTLPDQNLGKSIHLGVVRGGIDAYPAVQGTLTSMSTGTSTEHLTVEYFLDTGCLFANFIKAET